MDTDQIRILQSCRPTIINNLEVAPVLDHLLAAGVLLPIHYEEIRVSVLADILRSKDIFRGNQHVKSKLEHFWILLREEMVMLMKIFLQHCMKLDKTNYWILYGIMKLEISFSNRT